MSKATRDPVLGTILIRAPNTFDALKLAALFGCTIRKLKCSGEMRITHPRWKKPLIIGGRRKTAPAHLTFKLRQLIREMTATPRAGMRGADV